MKFKTPQSRKDWIKKCVSDGMTYQEIATLLNISRQRVHQLFREYSFVNKVRVMPRIDKTKKVILNK